METILHNNVLVYAKKTVSSTLLSITYHFMSRNANVVELPDYRYNLYGDFFRKRVMNKVGNSINYLVSHDNHIDKVIYKASNFSGTDKVYIYKSERDLILAIRDNDWPECRELAHEVGILPDSDLEHFMAICLEEDFRMMKQNIDRKEIVKTVKIKKSRL